MFAALLWHQVLEKWNAYRAAGEYPIPALHLAADDVLDVTASAETMGKPTGADAAAGRFTYPAVVGLERAREMANEEVARALRAVSSLESEPGPLAALA